MDLDNLTPRQSTAVFRLHTKLAQSNLHHQMLIQQHSYKWSDRFQIYVANRKYKATVPIRPFSPIKKTDICLADLLIKYPQYRFGYQQEF